ncbi:MAG TPA: EXLDI protein [Patescibacteria group bacterium]|nr:EXLDI protein [Patescibacteria group bacterium]
MPNKTIYVSDSDVSLFEEAKSIAGEALSSVISRALKEYVSRHREKAKGMKQITVEVGNHHAEREQRFVGQEISTWQGFSDDKEWYLKATIYLTQKGNWAVYLTHVCKASLFLDKKKWRENAEYLTDSSRAELIVGSNSADFETKLPIDLLTILINLTERTDKPVEYLDI